MIFPTVDEIPQSRDMIEAFGGYNHNLRIGDGEFYDETNMTSDLYPVLSNRKRRGSYSFPDEDRDTARRINGMVSKDSLIYIDGRDVYFNNEKISDFQLRDTEEPKKRQIVSMGAKVIFFPDNMYINTKDLRDKGALDHKHVLGSSSTTAESAVEVTFQNVSLASLQLVDASKSDTAPTEPANGAYWIDTSETPAVMKSYSSSLGVWSPVASVYIKITADGINDGFSEGDGISIKGVNVSQHPELNDLNNTSIIQAIGDNYIVVIGMLNAAGTDGITQMAYIGETDSTITLSREIPLMDYVVESNNRLWGCRYGLNAAGDVVNELYACKLGDPTNWYNFAGTDMDSYQVNLGSDGQFTGAITFLGHPLFFKEDCVHKVYGNFPSNFQVVETQLRGVEKGSSKSLAIVDETLFYKSGSGIMAYTGSLPTLVSEQFGDIRYKDAVCGSNDTKLYVSMTEINSDIRTLFVFDARKGIWNKEDSIQITGFISQDGDMFASVDGGPDDDVILNLTGGTSSEEPVEWYVETGILGASSPDKKLISRIDIRLSLDMGSLVRIYAEYDSSGRWIQIASKTGTKLGSVALPVRPRRCDHMKLRIVGRGNAKIYSISKTIEGGSDV